MIEVRAARPGEWQAVGRLTVDAYLADGLIPPGHWYTAELGDAARRAVEADLIVAEDDGALVGTATLCPAGTPWAEIAEPGEVEVRMLAVAAPARGRGVGETLMRASIARARSGGAARLVLTTVEPMHAAQRLYQRLGLRRVPERDWRVEVGAALVYAADLVAAPGAATEAATWPPLGTGEVGPWRLGFSAGLTRRANSAVLLGEPPAAHLALDAVERRYRDAGQPTIVRVATDHSPTPAPAALAAALDERGYLTVSTTRVLARPTAALPPPEPPAGVRITETTRPDDAWLDRWLGTKVGPGGAPFDLARRLLTGCPARYLTASDADGVLGVVRAAAADGWVGLSCLAVAPSTRRRGLARALSLAALTDLTGESAAFVQVEAENDASLGLFRSLGFAGVDQYAYRAR